MPDGARRVSPGTGRLRAENCRIGSPAQNAGRLPRDAPADREHTASTPRAHREHTAAQGGFEAPALVGKFRAGPFKTGKSRVAASLWALRTTDRAPHPSRPAD